MTMIKRTVWVAILAALSLGCGNPSSNTTFLTRKPLLSAVATQELFSIFAPGGDRLGAVPIENTNMDRIETDVQDERQALVVVHHGRAGGATMYLVEKGRPASILRETDPGGSFSRPVWSKDKNRFAYIVHSPPKRILVEDIPTLQFQGELWVEDLRGEKTQAKALNRAAQVLGWLDRDQIAITQYKLGDLPQERPYLVDLRTHTINALLPPGTADHFYNFAMTGERIYFVKTDTAINTLPLPDQKLQVMEIDPWGNTYNTIATEEGRLAFGFRRTHLTTLLTYSLQGSSDMREVNLANGKKRSIQGRESPKYEPAPLAVVVSLSMPYVNQLYDTPDDFNGNWACGPTSMVMNLCHFGRLQSWPIQVSTPTPHTSNYGAFIPREYTAFGTTFNRSQPAPKGGSGKGAYGWCMDTTADLGTVAWAWRMQDYAEKHELKTELVEDTSFDKVKTALDAGKTIAMSTKLGGLGHIVAIKGYTEDSKLIANDPYGDMNEGYPNDKGENAVYTWKEVNTSWFVIVSDEVQQPIYKAEIVNNFQPITLVSGATAPVSLTYKNTGTAAWDVNTMLGTTEPRDRKSVFFTSGNWKRENRPAAAETVAPGGTFTFSFQLTAPAVTAATTYTEFFNLVQENITWFSEPNQGGPADKDAFISITVTPANSTDETNGQNDGAVDDGGEGAQNTSACSCRGAMGGVDQLLGLAAMMAAARWAKRRRAGNGKF